MTIPRKIKTDWLAWCLHAVTGAVAGCAGGAYAAYRQPRFSTPLFASFEAEIPFAIGAALLGAAFGAYLGERWWSGPSIFRVEPEGFELSRTGRIAAVIVGTSGVVLMFAAILRENKVF